MRTAPGSEKTTESKIKGQKILPEYHHALQLFFNASLRWNEVIERAKQGFKDDYTNCFLIMVTT
jgi:hypothetical protein